MEPTVVEPPPPYTPCRPPSYSEIDRSRSDAPRGLPRLQYAPGFRPLHATNSFSQNSYNLVSWSTVHRNPARKQYENVARRRVQIDQLVDDLVSSITSVPSVPSPTSEQAPSLVETPPSPTTPTTATTRETSPSAQLLKLETTPANPLEDPELVGPMAAERNRRQRLYREMITQERCQAQDVESKSWDFMLAQSADWHDRQRSWDQFRETKLGLGRSALLRSRR